MTNYTGYQISQPEGITTGPDGALWFTNAGNNSIGRITTSGSLSAFFNYATTLISGPYGITTGSDGALWFTNDDNSIGRITTGGLVTRYLEAGLSGPGAITVGPDSALWFTNGTGVGKFVLADTGGVPGDTPPSITAQPVNQVVSLGQAATFTAAANAAPSPSVQWQVSTDGGSTYTPIAGATSGVYSFTPGLADSGDLFEAVFSNGIGVPATTSAASLTFGIPPTITSASSTTFTQGFAGTFFVTATGTPDPSLSETGTLPSGVAFSSTGGLSGTPTQSGTFPITITATNGLPPDATQSFTLTVVSPPRIISADHITFVRGVPGSFAVTAPGPPSATCSLTGAPGWLSIDPVTGIMSGTPPVGSGGTYVFTITATNGVPPDATQSFTLTVDSPPTITSADSTAFTQGQAGTFAVTASGFPASTFTETGSLPNGVTLTSSGELSGTPTQSGTFPVTITGVNGDGEAIQSFTLTVTRVFQIWTSTLPNATPGQPYGPLQLQSTGGGPGSTLRWRKAGALPSGLMLTYAGTLLGTPNPNLRLRRGEYLPVRVQVTETLITIHGIRRVKTRTTVSKTLTVLVG
ncbi:MAG: putative Ig domain-containing protein [Acidimicrobiales bacterium]